MNRTELGSDDEIDALINEGIDFTTRAETAGQLGDYFGDRKFAYMAKSGPQAGTFSEMMATCPAVEDIVDLGFDSAVASISAYEISEAEYATMRNQSVEVAHEHNDEGDENDSDEHSTGDRSEIETDKIISETVVDSSSPGQSRGVSQIRDAPSLLNSDISAEPRIVEKNTSRKAQPADVTTTIEDAGTSIEADATQVVSDTPENNLSEATVTKRDDESVGQPIASMPLTQLSDVAAIPSEASTEASDVQYEEGSQSQVGQSNDFAELQEHVSNEVMSAVLDDLYETELAYVPEIVSIDTRDVDEVFAQNSEGEIMGEVVSEKTSDSSSDSIETAPDVAINVYSIYENEASKQTSEQIIDTVIEVVAGFANVEAGYEPELDSLEVVHYVEKLQRIVLHLEQATTQEECRQRVEELQASLAELLDALGFDGSGEIAMRLIRQYDTRTLKQFIAALLKTVTAGELAHQHMQKKSVPLKHHWFGQRVVERVVRATSTFQLQSA